MQLNELIIQRNAYAWENQGIAAGAIGGRIVFQGSHKHEVRLVLERHQIDKILAIVAESMVETTRELANDLTANIIESATSSLALGSDA